MDSASANAITRVRVNVGIAYDASIEDAREKLEYDLYYIKHISLSLDLYIILAVMKRAIEHRIDGVYEFRGPGGPRRVEVRGIADRIDLSFVTCQVEQSGRIASC